MCVTLAAMLGASPAAAAYRFDVWNTDNGLPQNSVSAILQTRDGYLWLTTTDGLVRFDGVRLTVFDRAGTPGIRTNRFRALFEDRSGALWVGSEDGGVTRYSDGRFMTFTSQDGLPDDRVVGFQESDDGIVLVLTPTAVGRWSQGRFLAPAPYERGYRLRTESEMRGELWFSDPTGVHRFAHGRTHSYTVDDGLSSIDVQSVSEDARGIVWMATRNGGLNRIEGSRVTIIGRREGLSADTRIARVCEDAQGQLWIAARDGGVVNIAGGAATTYGSRRGLHR